MADDDRMNKMFNDIQPKYDLNLDESTCQWRLKGSWSSLERRKSHLTSTQQCPPRFCDLAYPRFCDPAL
jgi:hypothetical protein